jgi:uridine kinase
METSAVADDVHRVAAEADRPVVVGISGYCGAGKSTLARELTDLMPGAVRMRGDDFLDPVRSHQRSSNWDGVERERLVATVLEPFRAAEHGTFQRYDWACRQLGAPEPVPQAEILIVDLIGLFHPEALPALDLRIWCEADLEVAAAQGRERDRELGRRHDRLWADIWIPNDRDFAARFDPRAQAHVLYSRDVE